MAKILIISGLVLILAGGLWMAAERFGFQGLPGDIRVEHENFTFYFPAVTCLALSIILSIVFTFFRR